MVEQLEHEAPVFAISQSSLLGGHKEILLQYPAQLEPTTTRDIKRHRFTVRHGKKRRSFQAPDAATYHTWLSALKQALEPKSEPSLVYGSAEMQDRTNSSTYEATCQNSKDSRPRCSIVERPCFKRYSNNWKLIRLHRPATTLARTGENHTHVKAPNDIDSDVGIDGESTETSQIDALERLGDIEELRESCLASADIGEDQASSAAFDQVQASVVPIRIYNEPVDVFDSQMESEGESGGLRRMAEKDALEKLGDIEELRESCFAFAGDKVEGQVSCFASAGGDLIALMSASDGVDLRTDEKKDIRVGVDEPSAASEVKCKDGIVVMADRNIINVTVNAKPSYSEGQVATDAPKTNIDEKVTFESFGFSKTQTRFVSDYLWAPLDPNKSKLIWVRDSLDRKVDGGVQRSPSRKSVKQWVPLDPSNSRLIWTRRSENGLSQAEFRYKATSYARKWVPLTSVDSNPTRGRRHVVPNGSIATPICGKQRCH